MRNHLFPNAYFLLRHTLQNGARLQKSKYIVISKKICFSREIIQPIPRRHTAARDLYTVQVYCHSSLGLTFAVRPIAAQCWRGKGGNILKIMTKKLFLLPIFDLDIFFEKKTFSRNLNK